MVLVLILKVTSSCVPHRSELNTTDSNKPPKIKTEKIPSRKFQGLSSVRKIHVVHEFQSYIFLFENKADLSLAGTGGLKYLNRAFKTQDLPSWATARIRRPGNFTVPVDSFPKPTRSKSPTSIVEDEHSILPNKLSEAVGSYRVNADGTLADLKINSNVNSTMIEKFRELEKLTARAIDLPRPKNKFIDDDIEDALAENGFTYPSKTIYTHNDFPSFLIKTDAVDIRLNIATEANEILLKSDIENVIVPFKRKIVNSNNKSHLLIIEKIPLVSDPIDIRKLYKSLTVDEAADISFSILKTRIKDIEYESGIENLPFIKGTKQVAFIDTGAGKHETDLEVLSAFSSFSRNFSENTRSRLRKLTVKELEELRSPQDLILELSHKSRELD